MISNQLFILLFVATFIQSITPKHHHGHINLLDEHPRNLHGDPFFQNHIIHRPIIQIPIIKKVHKFDQTHFKNHESEEKLKKAIKKLEKKAHKNPKIIHVHTNSEKGISITNKKKIKKN